MKECIAYKKEEKGVREMKLREYFEREPKEIKICQERKKERKKKK